MDINLNKSTPRYIQLGTEDVSARALPLVQQTRPQHYPLFMSFMERGTAEPQHVSNLNFINRNFGTASMDAKGKFFNHQLLYLQTVLGEGNSVMLKRLIPAGAAKAMVRLSVEMILDEIDDYARDEDTGAYDPDGSGDPVSLGKIPGYRLRWILNNDVGSVAFGAALPDVGTMTSVAYPGLTADLYPIMDLEIATEGLYGDNCALRLSPATFVNGALDATMAQGLRSMMLTAQVVERDAATQTPRILKTLGGSTSVTLAIANDQYNPVTSVPSSFNNAFIDQWHRHDVPGQPNVLGTFGKIHVYEDNWATVVNKLLTTETDAEGQAGADFDGESTYDSGSPSMAGGTFTRDGVTAMADAANVNMLNIFTGRDVNGVPYFSFVVESDSLTFTLDSNHYAAGGSDGDVSAKAFDLAFRSACLYFGEETDYPMKNFVKYPFSALYDSGFTLPTKYALCNVSGVRHDTMSIFSTHTVYGPVSDLDEAGAWEYKAPLSEDDENVRGELLQQRITLTPESEYYGTKAFRAMIFGQAGKLLQAGYPYFVSPSIQYAAMCARFMGAANGKWNKTANPNVGENKKIFMFKSLTNTYADEVNRDKAWGACINKARDFDTSSYFWEALTTVYEDKTSVLINPNMAWAANTLYKVCHKVWQKFVGDDTRTPDQLVKDSDNEIDSEVSSRGIFADIVQVVPVTEITPDDSVRGFTWHTTVRMGGNNMRLVGVYTIEANRMEDLFS